MENRIFNFGAGPCTLPLPVLQQAQAELLCLPGTGMSVLEISHRNKKYIEIYESAIRNLRTLLNIPSNYQVLFLQGGATLQFTMVAQNFLRGTGKSAGYFNTGSWGTAAIKEAKKEGPVVTVWNGKESNFNRIPKANEWQMDENFAYLHFTSNETIGGVEWQTEPSAGDVPLVCDSSSDFMARPIDVSKYALIYAGAQKNAAPAGVTIVIIRDDMLAKVPENLPVMLDYKIQADKESAYNTPPVFQIYMFNLVTQWLLNEIGGLSNMYAINQQKANLLYSAIDQSGGFYEGHATSDSRSIMNVTWRMPSEELQDLFAKEAKANGMAELKGHRSVGGMRASIYNAMTVAGCQTLADFMRDFQRRHG
ncbi:MAG TPA: 3-phosphoserine/phosphohydroxythreonine transaminase [Anaerolineales bacterium]|nr:3-phosphoserine/phosphohydroxythreonine transaminase [Anaerolineales bacterium]